MKEDTIDLIDYLKVIRKRKILIIVVTLVSVVVGVIMSLRSSETYRADTLLDIGKKVVHSLPSSSSSNYPHFSLQYVESPSNLIQSIPRVYIPQNEGSSKYSIEVKIMSEDSLIKIIIEGSDKKRLEESIRSVANRIIDDHVRKTENTFRSYNTYMRKLEVTIADIEKKMDETVATLIGMKAGQPDPVAFVMAQNSLWSMKSSLESDQKRLLSFQTFTENTEEFNTKMVGGVCVSTMKPRRKRNVLMAGTAGFVMSLFLAFFMEYLGKEIEGKKENICEETTSC